ncbi:polyamine-transporting ATPase [Paractinoplanes abujensis]|uniref:Spermidine/putrescine import ATP-binding protein PotA n=1 Tax=Paractinoplanes abujensis TaxID=882441 RepID=A0A7W7FZU7_9ACTN|nr:ABC transporter ATP-binding protein [Actinoplanes abujensis]MBB4690939.1 spermidine/putrescine transport system ATP-binding protein [Actinoplanes abujensis]GID17648.1 polyamine-transporting ATPase [Actinoplanes abujensis]
MSTPQHSAVRTRPAAGDTPAIEFVGVNKNYLSHGETVPAVKRTDLAISQGEFFSLLGPSGCGKTTTMRMIAGFEEPTAGQVLLDGKDVTGVAANKRDVNMVFQSYALFPHLNTYQNVAFGLERRKVGKSEIGRRVGEILEIVSLTGMEKRSPKEMSGGQQQRVALARALVNRPRALLLDEPLGALDLKLRQQMQIELKRIQREVGITFVYVTHDQGEALTMSDRIAVMNAGVIEQLGSPREIYERPATRFVAGFIGTSNIVDGHVERVEGGLALLSYTTQDRVVVPVGPSARTGDKLEVSIRPEKIDLHRGVPPVTATGGSVLSGTVTEVVYHGTSTNYTVATAAGADFTVFDQNASNAEDLAVRGDRVYLTWAPQHSYLIGV